MIAKINFILSFLFIVLSISLFSCFKNEVYPDEPIISDPLFTFSGDSAKLTFSFTDGDGDVGLNSTEIVPPYDTSSYYHYNLYVDYYEKDDINGWQRGTDLNEDSIVFKYRIKPIIVKGKARGIKGTIDITIINFANPFSTESDTIKYSIKLIDKALHESNIIETEEIYL